MTQADKSSSSAEVETFIACVEPAEKRADAEALDAMFRTVTGVQAKLWPGGIIGYGSYSTTYDSGREVTSMRAGFSPRKARHSLYLMGGYCDPATAESRDALLPKLGKHAVGKSCLYINRLSDVDLAVLEQLIRTDWDAMNRLYPAG